MFTAFFHEWPILASILVLVISLFAGIGELDALKIRAPAFFTFLLGGMGALAATGSSDYPVVFKTLVLIVLLGAYLWAIRWILKDLGR